MKTHIYQFRVEWGDTDAAGIVFSPNFYKWMDEAIHYYFESIGYPLSKLFREKKIGLPIIESSCKFQKPLYSPENAVIHTTIMELREKSITFNHEFFVGKNKIAEGFQVRALASMDGERVKAISISEQMREAISRSGIIQDSQL